MLKIENVEVMGWEAAIRGMRNPMNSWEQSDSGWDESIYHNDKEYITVMSEDFSDYEVGPNDRDLMKRLRNAGTDHRKFMRMITVYVDITAPLYWWKEFDTYKVGTVANSCSTMHKIAAKEFTLEDFSHEHLVSGWARKDINGESIILPGPSDCLENTIAVLNRVRESYIDSLNKASDTGLSSKEIWWQMIQLLPSSYNQRRTVMLNYEVLANMYRSRKNHKLDEWHTLCDWIKTLPCSQLITGEFDKMEDINNDQNA